jgi:hypothetical protein
MGLSWTRTRNFIQHFSQSLSVDFTVDSIGSVNTRSKHSQILEQISDKQPYVVEQDNSAFLRIYGTEPDIEGKPAILITVDVPATITAQGRAVTRFTSLSILLAGPS